MMIHINLNRKGLFGIIGGLLGFITGFVGGGAIGFAIGGSLLGGLDLYEQTGLNGYELAAYIGAILGAVCDTPIGVGIALIIYKNSQSNL